MPSYHLLISSKFCIKIRKIFKKREGFLSPTSQTSPGSTTTVRQLVHKTMFFYLKLIFKKIQRSMLLPGDDRCKVKLVILSYFLHLCTVNKADSMNSLSLGGSMCDIMFFSFFFISDKILGISFLKYDYFSC